jgi:dihydrofolate reductase
MKLILACDSAGGIGYQNKLPWNKIQGDLPRFKTLTENQIVAMGRNTWDSLPTKPLPSRVNIVITNNPIGFPKNVLATNDLDVLKEYKVWLIGGAKLIKSCWDKIEEIHLTKTFSKYTCDVYIDLVKLNEFTLVSEEIFTDHFYQIYKRT